MLFKNMEWYVILAIAQCATSTFDL
jgi:hypothetical protein